MTSSAIPRVQTARDLFLEALEHPVSQRAVFLDGVCRGDSTLRAAVEELLANHQEDSFLEIGAVLAPTVITPSSEQPGERIGRYKLLQEIGEGGFGTVWMAEQLEPVTRRVALKIIKLGMDTREVIARFEAERQALAMMDHPNIARVLDAGATDKGRPFFVMELVKGMPLTQYCDEAGLGTRERLALFSDVCSAINHAHQKGVIHRDIKPSNVMVTLYADKPVVKVIDFGIAKATQGRLTDKTLFTRFEQFIGTPVYMSPEQAALSAVDIDTRSDIYALGVLLYELLVGKPPFDGKSLASAGYEEMRRIIREVEPPKPSSRLSTVAGEERTLLAKTRHTDPDKLNRLVEPDLDWIVMKAIEKDRTRRYETANGLALDIRRFLADEPVSATPPSAAYKFRKFARRNKTALRLAAALAAVLVAATAVSIWQAVRARYAEKQTADTLKQVAAERDAKEQARKDAVAISTFLTRVFQSPDPDRDGREIKVVEMLDRAARKLDQELVDQQDTRATLQATLGGTYYALGLFDPAILLHEKVCDYYVAALGPEHPETLSALHNLARSCAAAGRIDESLELKRRLLALRRKVNGPEHRDTLMAMEALAGELLEAEQIEEAMALDEELLELRRKVLGAAHPDTLNSMNNLSVDYQYAGRVKEALEMREALLPLRRGLNGAESPDTLRAMNNLAESLLTAKRTDEGLAMLRETLALRDKVLGSDHPDTIGTMARLASALYGLGQMGEALSLREKVLPAVRQALGPEHPQTLGEMTNQAQSLGAVGRLDEAIELQKQALEIKRRVLPRAHRFLKIALQHMIFLLNKAGRDGEEQPYVAELKALPGGN